MNMGPRRAATAIALFLVVLGVYLWNLETPVLWGDEADTAVFSRNVLRFGYPVADDSRNLMVTEDCNQVSSTLLSRRIPWVQYYVGAASQFLFGSDTRGARTGFAIIGACCFFPLAAVLGHCSRFPHWLSTLALLTPQVVLFHRNGRYYSILSLLFAVLIWLHQKKAIQGYRRTALLILLFALYYHTHYIAAFCYSLAILIYCGFNDSEDFVKYALAGALGVLSFLGFYFLLPGIEPAETKQIMILSEPTANIPAVLWEGLRAGILDLDFINSFPLMAAALLAAGCFHPAVRASVRSVWRNSLVSITLLCTALHLVVQAMLVGYETPCRFSLLRYLPHAIMGLAVIPALILERLGGSIASLPLRRLFFSVCLLAVIVSNVGTLSYWIDSLPCRDPLISWWAPVFSEIAKPPVDPVAKVVGSLPCKSEGAANLTLSAWPTYQNEVFVFYCGGHYLIIPEVNPGSKCEKAIIDQIGLHRYKEFANPPDKVVLFQTRPKSDPAGYDSTIYPFFRRTPDATRPELTRRSFAASMEDSNNFIAVYSRKD